MQSRPARPLRLCLNVGAYGRINGGNVIEPLNQRPKIEHAAADQNRAPPSPPNLIDAPFGIAREVGGGVGIIGFPNMNKMMRVVRFGSADRQAAIHQRRIHANEFGIKALGKLLGQCRLTRRRGAHQRQHGFGHDQRPRRNSLSRSAMPSCTQVGRPWLHCPDRSVSSISRNSAFISGNVKRRLARTDP